MSLNFSEDQVSTPDHPVDVIELLAGRRGWAFDRDGDDEITITVGGGWSDYHVSFTWLDEVQALHLACAFDIKLKERRRNEILKLVGLINEQLWVGHFGLWDAESMVIYRHALMLPGGMQPTDAQCESMLHAAISASERYFQSFQFVLWAGKTAREAIESALFETVGEA